MAHLPTRPTMPRAATPRRTARPPAPRTGAPRSFCSATAAATTAPTGSAPAPAARPARRAGPQAVRLDSQQPPLREVVEGAHDALARGARRPTRGVEVDVEPRLRLLRLAEHRRQELPALPLEIGENFRRGRQRLEGVVGVK